MQAFCRVPAIPGVRAAQLLRSRYIFSENITRGATFLRTKSPGGAIFREKLVGWSYPRFAENGQNTIGSVTKWG
mgnify:CR=1 FL=1